MKTLLNTIKTRKQLVIETSLIVVTIAAIIVMFHFFANF